MTNTSTIAASSRDLIVQLSRGNSGPARTLAQNIQSELSLILAADGPEENPTKRQAQQTMFDIEDVLALIDQGNLRDALGAARDAAKVWRAPIARD